MSTQPTGKQKSSMVSPDYVLGRPRRVTIAVAVLVAAALGLGAVLATARWQRWSSPGPVHMVHATWEDNCAVCHAPFSPTSGQNGLGGDSTRKTSDALCTNCHKGPPHHEGRELAADVPSCAGCHIDHRGRQALISYVPDRTCVNCHGDLAKHAVGGASPYAGTITSFHKDHPQFKLGPAGPERRELKDAKDPGTLRFNHKLHLTPGQKRTPDGARSWTLERITDPDLRARYTEDQKKRGKDSGPTAAVDLTCASCHQLDPTDAPPPAPLPGLPLRAAGAYFQPVTYDQHCKACHPLTFDPKLPKVAIPHRLQPEQVNDFLWGSLARAELSPHKKDGDGKKDDAKALFPPLPGLNLPLDEVKKRKDKVTDQVRKVEAELSLGDVKKAWDYVYEGRAVCTLCHEYERDKTTNQPTRIRPTKVPVVWYPHAKFSHQAHRGVDCLQCHDNNAPVQKGVLSSTTHTDVLLPGVATCQKCHAPATESGGTKLGGVRADCVTCHSYHHGEVPLAGRGAEARGGPARQDIDTFMRGPK